MASEAWVGLVRAASDAGFGRVTTKLDERGFWLACSDHRWKAAESILIAFPWSHLRSARADAYVAEIARMMKRYPPVEWGFRAQWIEWTFPLYQRLPVGPRPPKQLIAEASVSAAWAVPSHEQLLDVEALEDELVHIVGLLEDYEPPTQAAPGEILRRLYRDSIPEIACVSDLHFLAYYLLVSGDKAREVASMMQRGGLSTEQVAEVFRETFSQMLPEEWP
jgi:hypothetical protein